MRERRGRGVSLYNRGCIIQKNRICSCWDLDMQLKRVLHTVVVVGLVRRQAVFPPIPAAKNEHRFVRHNNQGGVTLLLRLFPHIDPLNPAITANDWRTSTNNIASTHNTYYSITPYIASTTAII